MTGTQIGAVFGEGFVEMRTQKDGTLDMRFERCGGLLEGKTLRCARVALTKDDRRRIEGDQTIPSGMKRLLLSMTIDDLDDGQLHATDIQTVPCERAFCATHVRAVWCDDTHDTMRLEVSDRTRDAMAPFDTFMYISCATEGPYTVMVEKDDMDALAKKLSVMTKAEADEQDDNDWHTVMGTTFLW